MTADWASSADVAYHDALQRLFARTGGAWRLGLERVTELLALLGQPHQRYPVFHVAGTNGKGSTVATLDALLRGAGLRVGRYTSPHLVDFAERVVVGGVPMPHAEITAWLVRWEPELTRLGATFFEATTAMALDWFAGQQVDVAIVEVGLGGRLDATNTVSPLAAAVTQIGFDHMEFLGDSLESIAGEKAGIFKAGAAAVVGEARPEIRALLTARAEAVGATPILVTGRDWQVRDIAVGAGGTSFTLVTPDDERRLTTPLIGEFQAHNAGVALAMLRGAGGCRAMVIRRGAQCGRRGNGCRQSAGGWCAAAGECRGVCPSRQRLGRHSSRRFAGGDAHRADDGPHRTGRTRMEPRRGHRVGES